MDRQGANHAIEPLDYWRTGLSKNSLDQVGEGRDDEFVNQKANHTILDE